MRRDVLVAIALVIYFSLSTGLFFYAGAGWEGFLRGAIAGLVLGALLACIVAEEYASSDSDSILSAS